MWSWSKYFWVLYGAIFSKWWFLFAVCMILWISLVFVMSSRSSLILLIWLFSLHILVNMNKGFSISSIFKKNQIKVSSIFFVLFFVFIFYWFVFLKSIYFSWNRMTSCYSITAPLPFWGFVNDTGEKDYFSPSSWVIYD